MLFRQKPKKLDDLVIVRDGDLNIFLQAKGFHPRYLFERVYYYIKSEQLEKNIQEWEVEQFV